MTLRRWLSVTLWLLGLWLSVGAAVGQTAAAGLYGEGNALYRDGEFAAARSRYLAAVETGVRDARLFYNLGNACFKDGRVGEAVVWYERALRLAPRDEDVRANLRFLRRIKRDQELDEPSLVYSLYMAPTLNELFLFASLCLIGVFVAASWRLWRGPSPAVVIALGICVSAALGAGSLAAARAHRDATRVEAVITAVEGTARSGPDRLQTSVFVIHEGTKVTVERGEGDWLLVRLDNGLGGWLPASVVTIL